MKKVTKHAPVLKPKKKVATKKGVAQSTQIEDALNSRPIERSPNSEGEQPFQPNHVQIEPLPPESHIN